MVLARRLPRVVFVCYAATNYTADPWRTADHAVSLDWHDPALNLGSRPIWRLL